MYQNTTNGFSAPIDAMASMSATIGFISPPRSGEALELKIVGDPRGEAPLFHPSHPRPRTGSAQASSARSSRVRAAPLARPQSAAATPDPHWYMSALASPARVQSFDPPVASIFATVEQEGDYIAVHSLLRGGQLIKTAQPGDILLSVDGNRITTGYRLRLMTGMLVLLLCSYHCESRATQLLCWAVLVAASRR